MVFEEAPGARRPGPENSVRWRIPVSLGIYIHFPYCRALCPYCDFNVHIVRAIPHREYGQAVLDELALRAPDVARRRLVSVYFGGGTPGLWHPEEVARVLEGIDRAFGLPADAEITLEVNPDARDARAIPALRAAGVNRLSIGAQSLRDAHLERLGRRHGSADAVRALEIARGCAFRSVSLDFLFALPSQTLAEWREDLDRIAALGADHLSVYNLTVEPETPLAGWVAKGRVALPPEDDQAELLLAARARLTRAGYEHYEVSSYARPGHRSVHNSLYWRGGEYLGLGAGAHGFVRTDGGGIRWADVDDPAEFMRRVAAGELPEAWRESRSPRDLALEALLAGLRWLDGLDLGELAARTGWDPRETHPDLLERLAAEGLAKVGRSVLRLTERGILLLDQIVLRFMSFRELDNSNVRT